MSSGNLASRRLGHRELHRFALGEALVPGGETAGAGAPAFALVAEIEIAERAADRDLADGDGVVAFAQFPALGLAVERGQGAAHLAQLRGYPILPQELLGPHRLVAAEDRRLEDAVAQRLLAERDPARLAARGEEL